MADKRLEEIVRTESKRDISLSRIAVVTCGYGLGGAAISFDNPFMVAPLTAAIGLGVSIYDEVGRKGLDLLWPFYGIVGGGFIGALVDSDANPYSAQFFSYVGVAIGGTLGFYKSYLNRGNEE